MEPAAKKAINVWDAPTRLFHWALVGLFCFSWWSAEQREMEWHILSGTAILGLLTFRILWGFFGGSTARFNNFVRSPAVLVRHLRGEPARPGHNPLGAYSVIAMLVLMILQVATGLFATDIDGLDSGRLSFLVSFDESRAAAWVHKVAFNGLLVLIGLHVLAILYYLVFRRRNLLLPMVTGRDRRQASGDDMLVHATWWKFVAATIIACAFSWWVWRGFGL